MKFYFDHANYIAWNSTAFLQMQICGKIIIIGKNQQRTWKHFHAFFYDEELTNKAGKKYSMEP